MKSKVCFLGFHKAATCSFGLLFKKLGLSVAGWKEGSVFKNSKLDIKKILKIAENYDAFQDNPWFYIYKQFHHKFPNTKFIYYERNVDEWYESCLKFFEQRDTRMREIIYGKGYGSPLMNENKYKEVYIQHKWDLIKYFSSNPNNFLHLRNLSRHTTKIVCEFLEMPYDSSIKMPHANKRRKNKNEENNNIENQL
jgi:hypothetical protein